MLVPVRTNICFSYHLHNVSYPFEALATPLLPPTAGALMWITHKLVKVQPCMLRPQDTLPAINMRNLM